MTITIILVDSRPVRMDGSRINLGNRKRACVDGLGLDIPPQEWLDVMRLSSGMNKGSDFFEHHSLHNFSKGGSLTLSIFNNRGEGKNRKEPSPANLLDYHRSIYLDFFLNVLYHRLTLMKFSRELSEIDELLYDNKRLGNLHRRFLDFTNKAWFGELTNAEYGQQLWHRWQTEMQLEQRYEEVKTQLNEFIQYIEQVRKADMDRRVAWLTFLGILLAITSSAISAGFVKLCNGFKIGRDTATWVLLIVIIGVLFFLGYPNIRRILSRFFLHANERTRRNRKDRRRYKIKFHHHENQRNINQ